MPRLDEDKTSRYRYFLWSQVGAPMLLNARAVETSCRRPFEGRGAMPRFRTTAILADNEGTAKGGDESVQFRITIVARLQEFAIHRVRGNGEIQVQALLRILQGKLAAKMCALSEETDVDWVECFYLKLWYSRLPQVNVIHITVLKGIISDPNKRATQAQLFKKAKV